jgi:hypothetical protein
MRCRLGCLGFPPGLASFTQDLAWSFSIGSLRFAYRGLPNVPSGNDESTRAARRESVRDRWGMMDSGDGCGLALRVSADRRTLTRERLAVTLADIA